MVKNTVFTIFLIFLVGLDSCSSAFACNCGCKNNNCGAIKNEGTTKEKKLFCELPKDWLIAMKETVRTNEHLKAKHVCGNGCNVRGGK